MTTDTGKLLSKALVLVLNGLLNIDWATKWHLYAGACVGYHKAIIEIITLVCCKSTWQIGVPAQYGK